MTGLTEMFPPLTFLIVCRVFPFALFNGSNCMVLADVCLMNSQYVQN